MAIAVPNDIVLGVSRAADPSAYEAAVARLSAMKSAAPSAVAAQAPPASFAEAVSAAAPPPSPPGLSSLAASTAPAGTRAADKTDKTYKQFEAFVLQTFVEAMLPQDADSVFGSGMAGQYWRSMMAEKLAGELAESGGVGIARQLAADAAKAAERETSTLTDAT